MSCPPGESLARFLRGELDAAEVAGMQLHLEGCPLCFKQLALGAAGMSESLGVSNPWLASRLLPSSSGRSARAEESSEPPPTELGPYVVERELGRGGMGVVYRARDRRTNTPVALKTVRTPTPATLEAMRREISFLAEARHPSLVRILDYELTRGDPWYAMELLEGETLSDRNSSWWRSRSRWPEGMGHGGKALPLAGGGHLSEILALFLKLCEPLDFLHRGGIVHCDLKPANVFLRDGSEPILMDFGLAIHARGAVGRESLSLASRRGTLHYMSPEIIQGKIPDGRADLYAFGCMLYESVVGRPPFVAARRDGVLDQHLHTEVVPASALVAGLPDALDTLLLELLQKDAGARLGEAPRAAAVLERLVLDRGERTLHPRAHLHRPPLVGRDLDSEALAERTEAALLGSGSFVLVSGESGIGKTFFVNEVCQRAMLRGMRVVLCECEPPPLALSPSTPHAARALHPFANLFNLLRDECRGRESDDVRRLLGEFPSVLATYSPALMTLPVIRDAGPLAQLPDVPRRERVLTALRGALRALANEQPLLLAIDDLHWADQLSLAFLEDLRSEFLRDSKLLVLGTYRTEESNPELERLASAPAIVQHPLGRLERASTSVMVGQMLGMSSPPPALVEFLGSASEGVPFFVAEYLRSALGESALKFERGSWHFEGAPATSDGNGPALGFPARLKELIRRRLSGLAVATIECIEVGAVLGRDFEAELVAEVVGGEVDLVRELLAEAVRRGVIEAGPRYRFAHDKFREVAYEGLSKERRAALHGAVARATEKVFADDTAAIEQRAAALARHFEEGSNFARAIDYLELAGLRSLEASANAEALRLFHGAVLLESRLPARLPALRRAMWERCLADALAGLGRIPESLPHLSNAAALLGYPIAADNRGAALQVARELARRLARRLLPPDDPHGAPATDETRLEAGRVYERLHRTAYFTGKAAHIFVGTLSSLNLWEPCGPRPELVTAYANTAQLCGVLPAHGWARAYLEKANRALVAAPDATAESGVRLAEGVYYMGVGECEKAIRQIEQGILLTERIGYQRRREESLAVRAAVDIVTGHWSSAARWTAPLEASARARDDQQMLCWCLNQRLECALLRGDYPDATRLINAISPLLPKANDPERLWSLGLSAYASLQAGSWQQAEATARAASELLPRVPPVFGYCIAAQDRLAEAWLRIVLQRRKQGLPVEPSVALALRKAVAGLARSARTFPVARPFALFHEGLLLLHGGRQCRAIRAFRRGLELAVEMQLVHAEARLSRALARTLGKSNEQFELERRATAALEKLELSLELDENDALFDGGAAPQLAT